MKKLLLVIWAGEPAVVCGILAVALDAAILLPDWRKALAVAAVALGAAGATRSRVKPAAGA